MGLNISSRSNSRNVLEIVPGRPAEKVAVGTQHKFKVKALGTNYRKNKEKKKDIVFLFPKKRLD